jgi:hypothetical protein
LEARQSALRAQQLKVNIGKQNNRHLKKLHINQAASSRRNRVDGRGTALQDNIQSGEGFSQEG